MTKRKKMIFIEIKRENLLLIDIEANCVCSVGKFIIFIIFRIENNSRETLRK